jgi:CheY-like chemotaxis protein
VTDPKQTTQPLNSLRLGQRELTALCDRLDAGEGSAANVKREFVRFAFRRTLVLVEVIQPGGTTAKFAVVSRNLSANGVSLLHSAYIHAGSRCVVTLPHPLLQWIQVSGKVARCVHRGGRVHEIGVRFDEKIQTRELLSLDTMNEAYTMERVDPARLAGRILVIDDSDLEHTLIDRLLDGTGLEVCHARSYDDIVAQIGEGFDMLLVDYHLKDTNGPAVIARLQEAGHEIPTLLITADNSAAIRAEMRSLGVLGCVAKPLNRPRLLRALAEFVLSDGKGGPLYSTLAEDNPAYDLVDRFVERLGTWSGELHTLAAGTDLDAALSMCRQIAGQASPLGFAELGQAAEATIKKLAATMSVRESGPELRMLISCCRRVKRRQAA